MSVPACGCCCRLFLKQARRYFFLWKILWDEKKYYERPWVVLWSDMGVGSSESVYIPIRPVTVLIQQLRTSIVSYDTDMVSYDSSGKKGLPALCCILPPASSVGVLCCDVTRTVLSILSHSHSHCITTKTTFSEIPGALSWSAIGFSVTRAVISLLPNILWCHSLLALDILFPWPVTMTKLASSSGCCH